MKDYPGAADHAQTLAQFVTDTQALVQRDDIGNDRKIEIINQMLTGPNGLKAASAVGEQSN